MTVEHFNQASSLLDRINKAQSIADRLKKGESFAISEASVRSMSEDLLDFLEKRVQDLKEEFNAL